jgi:hypothetical protein
MAALSRDRSEKQGFPDVAGMFDREYDRLRNDTLISDVFAWDDLPNGNHVSPMVVKTCHAIAET